MSQADQTPADPRQETSLATEQERVKKSMKAFGRLLERLIPSLLDFSSWIFAGLIGFTVLVMTSLFTIGPVDSTIMVATTAFALALPVDVVGLILLRPVQDLTRIAFEEEVIQAFQEAGFTDDEQVPSPKALETVRKRRTAVVLSTSLGILALSTLLTLIGMTATLWHMAWWIGVVFLVMAMISLVTVVVAVVTSEPPDSAVEKEQKRRYREEILRQAKVHYKKKN